MLGNYVTYYGIYEMISMIAAIDKNNVIGFKNSIPWRLPKDMEYFKQQTTGNNILMGRKTYESIGSKPLKNRTNIILSKSIIPSDHLYNNLMVFDTMSLACCSVSPDAELIVIGGENIYKQMLPLADRLYITQIDGQYLGDAYFPHIDSNDWEELSRDHNPIDEKHNTSFDFVIFERKYF